VRLAFTQPSKPVLLTGHDSADATDTRGYTYLLMPTRVAGRADG
jgi:DNA polymerase III sliding clamp (beta) subunit (PCNA family)